jgi:hypothetical protein
MIFNVHLFSIIQEIYEIYGNAASLRRFFDGSFTFNDCLIVMIIAKHIGKRTPLDVTPEGDAIIFHKVTSKPIFEKICDEIIP